METSWTWGIAAVWVGLALVASLLSIRFKMSVALVEILVGIAAGNLALLLDQYHLFGLHWQLKPNEWIAFLAGFGSILLTFMAGAEIEPSLLRKSLKVTFALGFASFLAPFLGAALYAYFVGGWDWNASLICGIALSTTSVAVVYAVMIETGLNETELGKLILAACFVTDLGTVVALGACFANYNWTLGLFAGAAVLVLWLAPSFVDWFFRRYATHMSEPGVKFVFFVLFALGSLAALANSEAVLPAYLVGLALAGVFARQRETVRRLRTTVFALLTPFYFLNAGMKVQLAALWAGLGLVVVLLGVKIAAKVVGVWPLARLFGMASRESNYTTLLMSTGLTFGTISALFGLNRGYIDEYQYSILVTVVIASAVVPTVIAQTWFKPEIEPLVAFESSSLANTSPASGASGKAAFSGSTPEASQDAPPPTQVK
ncbi:MAG: cation:proton antiporter [Thermoguttaceae bacterium]|jgi:Kef-type K+ transport system membrane component KefB|nr:cation:proton antiporter [Thermoguttaceae bacterium]